VLRLSPCPVSGNGVVGIGDSIFVSPPPVTPVGVRLRDANAEDDGCSDFNTEENFISGVDGGGGVRLSEVAGSWKVDGGAGERRRVGTEIFGSAAA